MSGNPPQHKDENKSGYIFEEKTMVVYNKDVSQGNNWYKFIKTYDKKYEPLTTFQNNKTLIFKSGALWQLEFFLNLVCAYPSVTKNIYTESDTIISYLTNMAKKGTQNNIELANQVGFKLILYTKESFLSEYYTRGKENVTKSVTGNTLNICSEYICLLMYDTTWKIVLPKIEKVGNVENVEKAEKTQNNTNFWDLEPGNSYWS